jgi:hypothetical protein
MTAHDRDGTMAGLLRRSLATPVPAQGECPGPDLLAAYYECSLGSHEMSHCEAHASHCAACREQLAMMARAEAPPQAQLHHGWLLDWRLLASAVTALLILTIWGMHRPVSRLAGTHTENEPLVAISKTEQISPPPEQSPESASVARSGAAGQSPSRLHAQGPNKARVSQKESLRNLPINGRNLENLSGLKRQADAIDRPSLVEPRALGEKSAAPPDLMSSNGGVIAEPVAPSPTANATVGSVVGSVPLGGAAGVVVPRAEGSFSAGVGVGVAGGAGVVRRRDQQTESVAIGAANRSSSAESGEQRLAQKIIHTPDPSVLWRIAGGGFIERSENGGATWRGQLPAANAQLAAGAAPTRKVLWLVGENGMILVTKDAVHWKKIPPPVPSDFVSVDAKSASSATVTVVDGQKFSTSNAGKKWVPAP